MENYVNGGVIGKWENVWKKSKVKRVWFVINSAPCSKVFRNCQ